MKLLLAFSLIGILGSSCTKPKSASRPMGKVLVDKPCSKLPKLDGISWDKSPPVASGVVIEGVCKSVPQAAARATCVNGKWKNVTGGCNTSDDTIYQ